VVRLGLTLETVGLVVMALSINPDVSFLELMPGFICFGLGVGFASSQLTNVVLSDVDRDKSGVASGANTTVRQLGGGLGAAIMGSFLVAQTIRHAVEAVSTSPLPEGLRRQATGQLRALGPNYSPPANLAPADAAALQHALAKAISAGTRPALFLAAGFVFVGTLISLLIPSMKPSEAVHDPEEIRAAIEASEPLAPGPAVVDRHR
jgi:hypothetical protein